MKNTKLIMTVGILMSLQISNAQWNMGGCTGSELTTPSTQRLGVGTCPGTGLYTQYDQVDIGGTSRLRFSGVSPAGTWDGTTGGVIGMDAAGFLVIMGGPTGIGLNGDPNGLNVNAVRLTSNGNVGIGTITPSEKLTVNGNVAPSQDNSYSCGTSASRWSSVWSTNGSIQTSDVRFKTNIKSLEYGLNEILKLNPVTYNWKENDNGSRIGLIAQELKR